MPGNDDLAGAIAYFEACEDIELLRDLIRSVRPRAAAAVGRFEKAGKEPPPPASVPAARKPASREQAVRLLRSTPDFAVMQALARAAGRRLEQLLSESSDT